MVATAVYYVAVNIIPEGMAQTKPV